MFATFAAKVFGGTTGAAEPGAFTKGDATPSEDGSTSVGETGGQEGDALSTVGSSDGGEYHPLEDGANGAREERAACDPQEAYVETPAQEAAQTVPSRGSSGGVAVTTVPSNNDRGEPVPTTMFRKTPPARTADRQAERRSTKRYRAIEDGRWAKGKADGERWIPEAGAPSFATLQGAVEHERKKTTERRSTWSNLRAQISSTRSAVGFEAAATRELMSEEHAKTRDEVRSGTGALAEHLQAGVDRILECQQRSGESSGSSQLVFFSRLLSELRVTELRQLLARRGIAVPAGGTKSMLARLAAEQLREEDL